MYLVKHQHAIAAGVDVEVQCVDRQRHHNVFLAAIKHLNALHREVVSAVVPGVTNKRDVRHSGGEIRKIAPPAQVNRRVLEQGEPEHAQRERVSELLRCDESCRDRDNDEDHKNPTTPVVLAGSDEVVDLKRCADGSEQHQALCQRDGSIGGVGRHRDGGEVTGGALIGDREERVRGACAVALQVTDHRLAVGIEPAGSMYRQRRDHHFLLAVRHVCPTGMGPCCAWATLGKSTRQARR
jgi:hypothetical protein